MRDYGKVQTEFWEHPGVRRLSTEGKLLYVYLLTGPHTNLSGCFKAPFGYVADDLGWGSETVSERFEELSREGFATYDAASRFVLVHGFLKFNKIANRNIAVPLVGFFNEVPTSSPLKAILANEIIEFVDKLDNAQRAQVEPYTKPSEKPFRERFPNPENREQGTVSREEGTSSPCPSASPSDASPPVPAGAKSTPDVTAALVQQAFDDWNDLARRSSVPVALKLTEDRRRKLRAKLAEVGLDGWRQALLKVEASPLCQGQSGDRGWRADIDFLFQQKSWNRLMEGSYDARPVAANQNRPGGRRDWDPMDQAFDGIQWPAETEETAA